MLKRFGGLLLIVLVERDVEGGLEPESFMCVEGEDRPTLVGTRVPGTSNWEREVRAIESRISMNLLVSRDLKRLGFKYDSLSLKYPDNVEKSAEQVAREETVPTETPSQIQHRFATKGLALSAKAATKLKRTKRREEEATQLRAWLSTLNFRPSVPDITAFMKDRKLYNWGRRETQIKSWWQQPSTPKRTPSEHAVEHEDVDHTWLRCIVKLLAWLGGRSRPSRQPSRPWTRHPCHQTL